MDNAPAALAPRLSWTTLRRPPLTEPWRENTPSHVDSACGEIAGLWHLVVLASIIGAQRGVFQPEYRQLLHERRWLRSRLVAHSSGASGEPRHVPRAWSACT